MVDVDAVRIAKNFGREGGYVVNVHVPGHGWQSITEFASLVGATHTAIAQLEADLDRWADEAPLWLQ